MICMKGTLTIEHYIYNNSQKHDPDMRQVLYFEVDDQQKSKFIKMLNESKVLHLHRRSIYGYDSSISSERCYFLEIDYEGLHLSGSFDDYTTGQIAGLIDYITSICHDRKESISESSYFTSVEQFYEEAYIEE